jgi:hypothetical protein
MVSEPVFITTTEFGPYRRRNGVDRGGQYITFCYVGQIPADAVRLRPRIPSYPIPISPLNHILFFLSPVC